MNEDNYKAIAILLGVAGLVFIASAILIITVYPRLGFSDGGGGIEATSAQEQIPEEGEQVA